MLALFLVTLGVAYVAPEKICRVTSEDWDVYKFKFKKTYHSESDEEISRLTYAKNLLIISLHNEAYRNNSVSYKLYPNQFTDMSYDVVQAKFPQTINPLKKCIINDDYNTSDQFQPNFDYTENGYRSKIHDQGLDCNSGWAYAVASALEIFRAIKTPMDIKTVSAQHLIDCAGHEYACINETSLTAFSYLANNMNPICDESDYPNIPGFGRGKCLKTRHTSEKIFTLLGYGTTCYKEYSLQNCLKDYSPVVLEFNQISFEFFHYSEGIFKIENNPILGTHYMTLVGYGKDSNGIKYWKFQNSFGEHWGENGYIRLDDQNLLHRKLGLHPYALLLE